MPRPLRPPQAVRQLSPTSVRRKLAGEEKIDEQLMLQMAHADTDNDTEAKLARLQEVSKIERDAKAERERLRDEIAPDLEDGSRLFVGKDGTKYFGYQVAPEDTVIDAELLKQLVEEDLYEELVEEKVNLGKFRTAAAAERIPDDVLVKVTRFKPKKPHVRFGVVS